MAAPSFSGRKMLLLLLLAPLSLLPRADAMAPPYVGAIEPHVGPDTGGFTVTITGRNLGFLDIDCTVKFGPALATDVHVTDSWDKLEAKVPVCPMCGAVDVVVTCGGLESNAVPYVMTNECYGPTHPGEQSLLPPRFSARENCTVCMDLVHLTMAAAADKTSYQGLQSAMQQACYTVHFRKWLVPNTKCQVDLSDACRVLVGTMGSMLLDSIWSHWESGSGYWNGVLPNHVCSVLQKCAPGAMLDDPPPSTSDL